MKGPARRLVVPRVVWSEPSTGNASFDFRHPSAIAAGAWDRFSDTGPRVVAALCVATAAFIAFYPIETVVRSTGAFISQSQQNVLKAPFSATVETVFFTAPGSVEEGADLLLLKPSGTSAGSTSAAEKLAATDARIETVGRLIATLEAPGSLGAGSGSDDAEVAALREQLRSFIESRENARSAVTASESLLQLARQEAENTERVAGERLQLVTSGVLPRLAQREIDREIATARRDVAAAEAELRQHRSSLIQASIQIQSFVAQTRAVYEKEARELVTRRADEVDAVGVAAQYTSGGSIKATVGGYAEASQPFFVGQSVELGEPLYNITPTLAEFVVEAAVANRDVDKIAIGDRVQIRPRGFASARFKPVEGRVEHIAQQAESLPSSAAMLATSQRREPEYKVRIAIVQTPLLVSLGLRNGMIADVTFVTGRRTAAVYLLSPILNRLDKPFSEAR